MPTRIKRYEERLDKLEELLGRIEAEMGPQAQLETREFMRGGIFGLFGGLRMIEIVATTEVTLDPKPPPERETPAAQQPPANSALLANAKKTPTPAVAPAEPTPRVDEATKLTEGLAAMRKAVDNGQRTVDVQADEPLTVPFAAEAKAPAPQPAPATPPPTVPREIPSQPQLPAQTLPVNPQVGTEPDVKLRFQDVISTPVPTPQETTPVASSNELAEIKNTISELAQTINLLVVQNQQNNPQVPLPAEPTASAEVAMARNPTVNPVAIDPGMMFSGVQRNVFDRLLDWNIGPYDAIDLINTVLNSHEDPHLMTEDALTQLVTSDICRNILLSGGIELRPGPPGKVVALVGATGIGKTTTIAKLAAHFAFQGGKRVSLISLDNYRIAAVEQLRTYTEIMGIDLDIVFSKEEFNQVLTQRAHNDLILIDTAGRSPLNTKQIFELRDTFSTHPPDEIHLVVSASTKGDDLRTILENFEPLSYDHVIVSKLDETRSLGCVYNINKMCQVPISYFTVGQSVPEDIRTATLSFIQAWIDQGRIV